MTFLLAFPYTSLTMLTLWNVWVLSFNCALGLHTDYTCTLIYKTLCYWVPCIYSSEITDFA